VGGTAVEVADQASFAKPQFSRLSDELSQLEHFTNNHL
jgi:hypothetical protein